MDYSASNHELWNVIVQFAYIAAAILIANVIRQRISFVRKSMMPIAVLAGFLVLISKYVGIVKLDKDFMEMLTYHGIALGFIAMSLRVPEKKGNAAERRVGFKSGAIIVSTYMVQGIVGLIITITLGYTIMPDLFKAAGLLLPMGFGQGPGQANNIGASYQAMGFKGGHSFGLAIAAMGYIVACVVGVIILNVLRKQGKFKNIALTENESYSADYFHSPNEISISESIDKLSVQLAMIILVYAATFLLSRGITGAISMTSEELGSTVNTLVWGFNFIIGSALAMLLRALLERLKAFGAIRRQYQNNYLLNRLSGAFFDIMIVAGIACIDVEDIRGLVLPFVLLCLFGGIATWIHLSRVCKAVYKDYYYEGLLSMFGMLTGTISSGVLLLRELDPGMTTPAANNLITGSSFGILLGAPILVLVGLAPKSDAMCLVTLGLVVVYLLVLLFVIYSGNGKRK